MIIELTGEKIRLVNTAAEDLDRIVELEQRNSLFIKQYPKEMHMGLLRDGDCLHLSIKRKDNDWLTGFILVFGLENINKSLEFRRIAVEEKGMGFGREAVQLLKMISFEIIKTHRLWLEVYDDNPAAISLYESEGFIHEGTLRENIKTAKGYRSLRVYSLLEEEYKTLKS